MQFPLTTTLNKIRAHGPCESGWSKLLKYLGKTKTDDEPVLFSTIVESNSLDDALWCLRSTPEYARECRLFAVWCARQVQHLTIDARSFAALDVAEQFANDNASQDELAAARDAAEAAGWAAAEAAARATAWDAARTAACYAAEAATEAAAWAAAWDAAWDAAWAVAKAAQKTEFLRMCAEGYPSKRKEAA